MDKKQYLMMCEQLNKEPNPEEMPADFNEFPSIVQDAIQIYSILPDVWEGFGGTFLGKDYSILPYLTERVYIIDNHPLLMKILLIINGIVSTQRADKQRAERNKQKRKGKNGR